MSLCFNILKLPDYKSKKTLKEKILYSIRSNRGFGSLYILIIAKEILHVCLINPYGNLYYIDDLQNIIEQLIARCVEISSTSHEAY